MVSTTDDDGVDPRRTDRARHRLIGTRVDHAILLRAMITRDAVPNAALHEVCAARLEHRLHERADAKHKALQLFNRLTD